MRTQLISPSISLDLASVLNVFLVCELFCFFWESSCLSTIRFWLRSHLYFLRESPFSVAGSVHVGLNLTLRLYKHQCIVSVFLNGQRIDIQT